jgi:hypothetical protein
MKSVGNQGEGAKNDAADDFQHHHGAAEADHGPGLTLGTRVPFTEEDMTVPFLKEDGPRLGHKGSTSPQVGANDREELFRCLLPRSAGPGFRLHKMRTDVILYYFRRKPRHSGPGAGQKVHHLITSSLTLESSFDRLNLATNAPHPRQELSFFTNRVGHSRTVA